MFNISKHFRNFNQGIFELNLNMKTVIEKELLPSHYVKIVEPSFQGRGMHSVNALEDIAESYKELVHQLRVREQLLLKICDIRIV